VTQNTQHENESEKANQMMSEKFKDYEARTFSAADSAVESTNQKIQEMFYGNDEDKNFLPFHIESSSPPIKK
jgi:hypothetical protein